MTRKSTTDMKKTRQCLLESGLQLLQEKGYNATGIQEITVSANIPKGSFYNYFTSKEDFAAEVIRYYSKINIAAWLKLLQTVSQEETSGKALAESFLYITEKYRCTEIKKGCLLGSLSAEISEASEECRIALKESIDRFKTVLSGYLLSAQRANLIRSDIPACKLADLIWDCWQGSLLRMKVEKSVEPVRQNLKTIFTNLLSLQ